jgi:hypothetical protein
VLDLVHTTSSGADDKPGGTTLRNRHPLTRAATLALVGFEARLAARADEPDALVAAVSATTAQVADRNECVQVLEYMANASAAWAESAGAASCGLDLIINRPVASRLRRGGAKATAAGGADRTSTSGVAAVAERHLRGARLAERRALELGLELCCADPLAEEVDYPRAAAFLRRALGPAVSDPDARALCERGLRLAAQAAASAARRPFPSPEVEWLMATAWNRGVASMRGAAARDAVENAERWFSLAVTISGAAPDVAARWGAHLGDTYANVITKLRAVGAMSA